MEGRGDSNYSITRWPFLVIAAIGFLGSSAPISGQIFFIDSFNPSEIDEINGIGFDPVSGHLFLHESFNTSIHEYSSTGTLLNSISDPGSNGNDSDYEFAFQSININGTIVPPNSLLVIDGETDPQRLIAVDKTNGSLLASVNLAEPIGVLTGGSFHLTRQTFITIDWNDDLIREFDSITGNQLNSFGFGSGWDAFFSDVEVLGANDNLYLVSDSQNTIRILTPTGTFVENIDVGSLGVSGMSGIAFDDLLGEAWISSINGNIYHLGGFEAIPEPSTLALWGTGCLCLFLFHRRTSTQGWVI